MPKRRDIVKSQGFEREKISIFSCKREREREREKTCWSKIIDPKLVSV